jgi:Dyp-type peroxidase family
MTLDLSKPLRWRTATGDAAAMLQQLQANILRPHRSDITIVHCCRFTDRAALVTMLTSVRPLVKSAAEHLAEDAAQKAAAPRAHVGVGLSTTGYELLELGDALRPFDHGFTEGVRARALLDDLPAEEWQAEYVHPFDVIVVVSDNDALAVEHADAAVRPLLAAATVHTERAHTMRNADGRRVEHFGFADGLSQPLFLAEEIDRRPTPAGGWSAACPIGLAITPDHGVPSSTSHFGSYLVVRKLEQNVRRFAAAVEALAPSLLPTAGSREHAAALLVGRFRDGTPLAVAATPRGLADQNSFRYADDLEGHRCPLHAHTRKMNARGTGEPTTAQTAAAVELEERQHLLARRGHTYGVRVDDPCDHTVPVAHRPDKGVGLLFMAVCGDIEQQFEFVQRRWANAPDFPTPHTPAHHPVGVDPLIGNGPGRTFRAAREWDGDSVLTYAMQSCVRLLGAEYFFLPSLDFLANPLVE